MLGGALLTIAWLAAGSVLHIARIGIVGDLAVGFGLVLAGVGIRRRYPACWLLMVAGGAWSLEGVVLAVDAVVVFPRWAFTAMLAIVAATTVAAAIGMIVRGRVGGVARWILGLPAATAAGMALSWAGGIPVDLGVVGPAVLGASGIAPLAVGIVWLFVRDPLAAEPAPPLATPLSRT